MEPNIIRFTQIISQKLHAMTEEDIVFCIFNIKSDLEFHDDKKKNILLSVFIPGEVVFTIFFSFGGGGGCLDGSSNTAFPTSPFFTKAKVIVYLLDTT